MKDRELKIEVPDGYEIDKEKSTFEKIVFKKVEKELPKCWEELDIVKGFYVDSLSKIASTGEDTCAEEYNRNTFPTKEEAKAALAISQLLQWRNKTLGDWKPDFKSHEYYYAIVSHQYEIKIRHTNFIHHILTFETHTQAYEFMKNHKELLEQAKPLL